MIDITDALINICGRENVYLNEPMMKHTSFRIGGPADWFVSPADSGTLCEAIKFLRSGNIPYFILGNGSNLLVSDDGYRGVVIQIGKGIVPVRRVFALVKGPEAAVFLQNAALFFQGRHILRCRRLSHFIFRSGRRHALAGLGCFRHSLDSGSRGCFGCIFGSTAFWAAGCQSQ